MSKERERFNRSLPDRQLFYRRCAGLAFGMIDKTARRNWLRAICDSDERLRESILRGFVDALAKEMASAEFFLKRTRGRLPKVEETELIEAECRTGNLSLTQAAIKTRSVRTIDSAKKKAAAIRSRRYRTKKKA